MDNVSMNVDLGSVVSFGGSMSFKLLVEKRQTTLKIIVCDSTNPKNSVCLDLNDVRYHTFKKIIMKIETTIEELKSRDMIPDNQF